MFFKLHIIFINDRYNLTIPNKTPKVYFSQVKKWTPNIFLLVNPPNLFPLFPNSGFFCFGKRGIYDSMDKDQYKGDAHESKSLLYKSTE